MTTTDAGLVKAAAKAQEKYRDYMEFDGDDDGNEDARWKFIDAALDVLEAVTGVPIEALFEKAEKQG